MLNEAQALCFLGPAKANCYSPQMGTVRDIRLANLLALLALADSDAAFAREMEVEPAYISQLRTGERNIGHATARKIERNQKLPPGWMDQPQKTLPVRVGSKSIGVSQVIKYGDKSVTPAVYSIPLLEVEGGMGGGRMQPEYETIIGAVDVNEHFIRTRLPQISSPMNLRQITGVGDSMSGTYEDGDVLFVDTGVKEIRLDAVYVFSISSGAERELFIKRMQRRPDGSLTIISDNKKYEPYVISKKETRNVSVIGRVVGLWNWRKL